MTRKTEKALFLIVLVALLIPLGHSLAQTAAPLKTDVPKEKLVAELERAIPDLMKKASIPGLTISQDLVRAAIGGDKELGIAYLGYDQHDSPGTSFFKAVLEKGADEAVRLFPEFRKKQPDEFNEAAINRIGYQLMSARRFKAAVAVLKLNVDAYPLSANVYDSLAEAYLNNGDKELTVTYYKRALEAIPKDPRPDKEFLDGLKKGAEEKLKELEKKQ